MRTDAPRIAPVQDDLCTQEQSKLLEPYRNERGVLNIYRTMARIPAAARGFLGWGRYVFRESGFDPRLRELAILRVGWLCRSGYEWTQHSRVAKGLGITDAEIERLKSASVTDGWDQVEQLVLMATDELHTNHHVSDPTWKALVKALGEERAMDVVFVVGHYTQVCMILNSFGIQVEGSQTVDPDLKPPSKL
jgi:4-carboxymuconolactone decarboxylase